MTALVPGQRITIHAAVEQVCAKGDVCARVSNGLLFVALADIAGERQVRYRAAQIDKPLTVLAEHGDRLWVTAGGEPFTVCASWVEEIPAADPARG